MSLPSFPRAPGAMFPEPGAEDPATMLQAARAASAQGEFAKALELYETFFDRTADDETGSFYGVRLSYCLDEWASLGVEYPPAQARLLAKKDECRRRLQEHGDVERFHDYKAICEALGDEGSAVGVFLDLHERDASLAAEVHRFISHELVDFGLWTVASAYVPDAVAAYETAVERYGEAMRISEENPDLGGGDFAQQVRGWLIRDLQDLWSVLSNAGRLEEALHVREAATGDPRLTKVAGEVALAFEPPSPHGAGTTR